MHRLPLAIAIAACVAALTSAAQASAGVVSASGPIRGELLAVAFSGDALIVVRRPQGRAIRVELLRPGRPTELLLLTDAADSSAGVTLAASPQVVAVGVNEDSQDASRSHVWVGPPTGPLREVATCSRSFFVPAVAVDGPRVAWADGGCGGPTGRPREVGPASIAFGAVDPGVAVTRVPVQRDAVPVGVAFRGDSGLAGILRPTFFSANGDVRPFGPGGLGEARDSELGGALVPAGLLADGTGLLARSSDESSDSADSFDADGLAPRCRADTVLLPPGAGPRRSLQTGGCLAFDEVFDQPDVAVAGDRVVSRVTPLRADGGRRGPEPIAITSVRPDGGGLKTIVSGSYRAPRGLAADGSRVAWWQRHCAGGEELVVADGPVPALRACTLQILTRRPRLRAGRIALQVRCPLGCKGSIVDDTQCGPMRLRRFTLTPGTRRLRVPLPRRSRQRGRLLLRIEIEGGPVRRAVVRLRR